MINLDKLKDHLNNLLKELKAGLGSNESKMDFTNRVYKIETVERILTDLNKY
jgi:hypothetical protein